MLARFIALSPGPSPINGRGEKIAPLARLRESNCAYPVITGIRNTCQFSGQKWGFAQFQMAIGSRYAVFAATLAGKWAFSSSVCDNRISTQATFDGRGERVEVGVVLG
ncbi:hypothetical protein, partial [Propionivibrio sp.]|uniref:hypothetical protein n=1 Tax=Propionivibrio sp. TaxID=2212460 RepID=UPI003BF6127F